MATYAYYLTEALKKLDPPTDWSDIVEYVLVSINCSSRRHKHYAKQLHKALIVGLRFGIIKEIDEKYYLYEYGKVDRHGQVTYEFTENPLSAEYKKQEESDKSDESDLTCSDESMESTSEKEIGIDK